MVRQQVLLIKRRQLRKIQLAKERQRPGYAFFLVRKLRPRKVCGKKGLSADFAVIRVQQVLTGLRNHRDLIFRQSKDLCFDWRIILFK